MQPINYSKQYLKNREEGKQPKESLFETAVTFLSIAVMSFIMLTIFIGVFHG